MTQFVIFNVFHYSLLYRDVNRMQVLFAAGEMDFEGWREGGMKPGADITFVNKLCQLHYFICNVSVCM